jgi:hypothetical protein
MGSRKRIGEAGYRGVGKSGKSYAANKELNGRRFIGHSSSDIRECAIAYDCIITILGYTGNLEDLNLPGVDFFDKWASIGKEHRNQIRWTMRKNKIVSARAWRLMKRFCEEDTISVKGKNLVRSEEKKQLLIDFVKTGVNKSVVGKQISVKADKKIWYSLDDKKRFNKIKQMKIAGWRNEEIAEHLGVTVKTIQPFLRMAKLDG